MSRWKKPDEEIHDQSLYMRDWLETEKGQEYKESRKEYLKQWRADNKEKKDLIQKRSMYNVRLKVMQHYSGLEIPECRCCGENTFGFLQFDHINGDGADHRRELGMSGGSVEQAKREGRKALLGGNNFPYWLIKNDFPEGFQILCANCNTGKGTGKHCPHEFARGYDLDGNQIPQEDYPKPFPEPTRRGRGEAKKEADKLGISVATLNARERKAKNEQ